MTVSKFIDLTTIRCAPRRLGQGRGPNGRGGQPQWATMVESYSSCATEAGLAAVRHGGRVVQPPWPTVAGRLTSVRAKK
jgi:hypothetical protein